MKLDKKKFITKQSCRVTANAKSFNSGLINSYRTIILVNKQKCASIKPFKLIEALKGVHNAFLLTDYIPDCKQYI